jgi:hypothetical protein
MFAALSQAGLFNPDNRCHANVVLQMLAHARQIRAAALDYRGTPSNHYEAMLRMVQQMILNPGTTFRNDVVLNHLLALFNGVTK